MRPPHQPGLDQTAWQAPKHANLQQLAALPAQARHQPRRTPEQNCDERQLHERASERRAPQQVLTLHPPVQAYLTEDKVLDRRHQQGLQRQVPQQQMQPRLLLAKRRLPALPGQLQAARQAPNY